MPAYVVVDIEVTDPAAFGEYGQVAGPIIAAYGGRLLAAGPPLAALEGGWLPPGLTLIEFPDAETARRWHAAPEYQGPKALRQRASTARSILVDGFPGPPAPERAPPIGL